MGQKLSNLVLANHTNVYTKIVASGMCVGCGVCAGICPASCLDIQTNEYGEYVPAISGTCVECGLCLKVCPFCDSDINEDTIGKNRFGHIPQICNANETGYYLKCYAGKILSQELLLNRSSGGMASWFLAELLRVGRVDCVACVVSDADPNNLFRFALLKTQEEVWNASTSCYYPVEMSEVLRTVRRDNRRFAFIGLPCFLKGLYKAMDVDAKLAERIVVLAGLVCSHLKSKFFAEYLVRLAGVDLKDVKKVNFRRKLPGKTLGEYEFVCQVERNGKQVEYALPNDDFMWPQQPFKLTPCDYCDDVFAEVADIVFMDAWLPEYMSKPGGIGLTIARSKLALELLQQGQDRGELLLESLPVDKIIKAQRSGILRKREQMPIRLALAERKGRWFPAKRIGPKKGSSIAERLKVSVAFRRNASYRVAFAKQKQAGPGLETFHREVLRLTRWDRLMRWLLNMARRVAKGK